MYRVFENEIRCNEHKISEWGKDTFESKREAEVYAYYWAYPVTKIQAEKYAPKMEIGKSYNYSMSEFPILMKIEMV